MECAGTSAHTPGTHLSPTPSTVSVNSQELQRTVLPTGRATAQPGGFQVCLKGLRARLPRTSTGWHGAHTIRSGRRWASPGVSMEVGPPLATGLLQGPPSPWGCSHPAFSSAQSGPHSRALSGPWFRPAWASPRPVSTGELHLGPDSELWTGPTLSPSQETWLQAAGPHPTPPSAHLTNRKAGSR